VSAKEGDDEKVWRDRRERSDEQGADAFHRETRERDRGKGVRYNAIVKREGDPAARAHGILFRKLIP
jgi:hypothetical protein